MQVRVQIVFEHIGHSDALEAAVRNEAIERTWRAKAIAWTASVIR